MSEYRHTPDSLAERLDELLPPGQPNQVNHDSDPLIQAAAWLASAPHPQISPEAMARIQAQVVRAQRIQHSSSRLHFATAARWLLAASIVLIVLFVGAIPPSLASVPGDFLYPFKQVIEQAELAFANSPPASAVTHMVHAERRSQEVTTLLTRGQFEPRLIRQALAELSAAAQIAQTGDGLNAAVRADLERRTAAVNAQINTVLALVGDSSQVPDATVIPLVTEVRATQNSGGLLLPTTSSTIMPSPTDVPTHTPASAMETASPAITLTASTSPTETVAPTLFPTSLPVNLIIEGPVQAINGSIVVIYGYEIQLSPDHPLLRVIQIGDVVRIEGNFGGDTVVAIHIEVVNIDIAVNEAGEVWRDTGGCNNSPPPWAVASGWRARCTGQQPGNAGGNNNGGNRDNRGNRGGMGNSGIGSGS